MVHSFLENFETIQLLIIKSVLKLGNILITCWVKIGLIIYTHLI